MIKTDTQRKIEEILEPEMQIFFNTDMAKKLLEGKEAGHIMGTIVEEKCGEFLVNSGYAVTKELDKNGNPKKRAHSDFIITSDSGKYQNLVNSKFSSENCGQPNICSASRLMKALKNDMIDGYYMLKVRHDRNTNSTSVYFVDILDYIDCLTYNGGTGQIMLKEKDFYEIYESQKSSSSNLDISKKKKLIYEMCIRKMEEHILLKQTQLGSMKSDYYNFS